MRVGIEEHTGWVGFMATWKRWVLPSQSPLLPSSYIRQQNHQHYYFHSLRGNCFEPGITSTRSCIKAFACSYEALEIRDDTATDTEVRNARKKSNGSSQVLGGQINMVNGTSAYLAGLTSSNSLQFSLLMENIVKIEDSFAGSDLVRLEGDILVHIRRLGALKLFHECLSRTLAAPIAPNQHVMPTKHLRDCPTDFPAVDQKSNEVVRSGRSELRKVRRTKASEKGADMLARSTSSMRAKRVNSSMGPMDLMSKKRKRAVLARNESQMSIGVKEVAELERTQLQLQMETGQAASYARWAEAAGIDQEMLKKRLKHGWYCRDKLIKSTRSLVMYLAKNYRGMGVAFDDLLQAGNIGVLKGAERFDDSRGYRFSTYVQYWIRKSILASLAKHSRAIQIPVRMEKVINRVQKARRAILDSEGSYPKDDEIASFTGLSLANVRLARKCSRNVGSIDQNIGHGWLTTFMEVTADASVRPPDEVVMRQHMRRNIIELLQGLDPKERQVLVLRYGLDDGRCKSLEEIGRLYSVTKEWIRKLEKTALEKIGRGNIQTDLKQYLYL